MEGFVPAGAHHIADGVDDGHAVRYRQTLARLADQTRDLPAGHPEAVQLGWLRRQVHPLDERLLELDRQLSAVALRRHVIHGDFGLHNLLFRANGTAVLHDFELARVDHRLADLVGALSRAETDPASVFLASYRAENAIDPDEWACLPAVWELVRIGGALRSWANYAQYGDPRRLHTARRRIGEAAAIRGGGLPAWR
jgi:Ser/Thr protein kinase RdoA (MazF antagonist)